MENQISATTLLKLIEGENIVVYGAGHIGRKFLKALQIYHYDTRIRCFIVTAPMKSEKVIEGIPVKSIKWLAGHKDIPVCIAVHETLRHDIVVALENIGVSRYIWIYPYLYELLLGRPVGKNVKVNVDDLVEGCEDDYRLAIRYAAIEQYLNKNEIGFDMYKRAQALHSSPETATERLDAFCRLIESWKENGYDRRSRIAINTDYEIIDGNHRVALAKYFGQKQIQCDMYEKHITVTELHGENAMLTERVLRKNGFNDKEMAYLEKMNRMIKGG